MVVTRLLGNLPASAPLLHIVVVSVGRGARDADQLVPAVVPPPRRRRRRGSPLLLDRREKEAAAVDAGRCVVVRDGEKLVAGWLLRTRRSDQRGGAVGGGRLAADGGQRRLPLQLDEHDVVAAVGRQVRRHRVLEQGFFAWEKTGNFFSKW